VEDRRQNLGAVLQFPTMGKLFRKWNTVSTSSAPTEQSSSAERAIVIQKKKKRKKKNLKDAVIISKTCFMLHYYLSTPFIYSFQFSFS